MEVGDIELDQSYGLAMAKWQGRTHGWCGAIRRRDQRIVSIQSEDAIRQLTVSFLKTRVKCLKRIHHPLRILGMWIVANSR